MVCRMKTTSSINDTVVERLCSEAVRTGRTMAAPAS
jgi:hypothetical protein